jgi:hypothetical protein
MNIRYTLKEANQVLKLVRIIAHEMLERRNDRHQLARRRAQLETAQTPEGLRSELSELDARIWEHVLRTNPLTVHFPGRNAPAKGRKEASSRATATPSQNVVFCWQEGEDGVGFGHPLGEEEDQRRPLRVAEGA